MALVNIAGAMKGLPLLSCPDPHSMAPSGTPPMDEALPLTITESDSNPLMWQLEWRLPYNSIPVKCAVAAAFHLTLYQAHVIVWKGFRCVSLACFFRSVDLNVTISRLGRYTIPE